MDEQEDQNTLTLKLKTDVLPSKNTLIFKLLQSLPLKKEENVLEIGPTDTEHLSYLFQKARHINYTGTYLAETGIKKELSTYKTNGNTIDFAKITDNEFDLQDNSFDWCFTANTVYFWPDPLKYLSESYRVLKSGGKMNLAFVEKNFAAHLPWTQLDFTFYEINEVKSLFKQSGFVNIEVRTMTETITDQNGNEISKPFVIISGQKNS